MRIKMKPNLKMNRNKQKKKLKQTKLKLMRCNTIYLAKSILH